VTKIPDLNYATNSKTSLPVSCPRRKTHTVLSTGGLFAQIRYNAVE
jgi:hypothetical protein